MKENWILIVTYAVAIIIEIGLPITLAFVAVRKLKVAWIVILTGVLTFIGSQVVHIPVLQIPALLVKGGIMKELPSQWPVWAYALYLGILAGLCEETARLIGFKLLKKKAKDFTAGLALGIGHGGTESVLLAGLPVLVSLLSVLLYNAQAQLARGVPQDTVNMALAQMASFWSTPWHLPLAGAVERITAVSAQILMSILVWKTVTSGKAWWYWLSVLYHTIIDGTSVWLVSLSLTAWQIEGSLCVFLVIDLILIWRFWVGDKAAKAQAALAGAHEETAGVS